MKSRALTILVISLVIYFIVLLYLSFILFKNGNILGGIWLFLGVILTMGFVLLVKGSKDD